MNRGRGGCGSPIWNLGTLAFIVATLALCAGFTLIFMDPSVTVAGYQINPFPPQTNNVVVVPTYTSVAPLVQGPTNTSVPLIFPATATDTPQVDNSPTNTATVSPTKTSASPIFTNTPVPTVADGTGKYVVMDPGEPLYQPYSTCDGMWVGGAIFDENGDPIEGEVFIELTGPFGEEGTFSGTAAQYGETGYEIEIVTGSAPSSSFIFLQLYDGDLEVASDKIPFNTKASCNENLILINWTWEP